MRYLFSLMILVSLLALGGCTGESETAEIEYSRSRTLVPSAAASCFAQKNAVPDPTTGITIIERDISQSYYKIPTIKFNRTKNLHKTVYITSIRITLDIKGEESQCIVAGDELAALSSAWWGDLASLDAKIPPNQAEFSTDCTLYCGGLEWTDDFLASGILEVYGYEEYQGDEKPFRIQDIITVRAF